MKPFLPPLLLAAALGLLLPAANAPAYVLFQGDGSDEPGFVSPTIGKPPPPPPAHMASAETYIPGPPPPVTPQARSEKKKPPSPPVMFTKLTSPHGPMDWCTRPNDLNNLLKSMKENVNIHFTAEVKSLGEVDLDPDRNPILYRSGHFHFSFTPQERERVRQYLLKGGMLILNTGMGSKPFYDSAIRELQAIFPEAPPRRLGPDHPVFHSYYDLNRVDYRSGVRKAGYGGSEPWFDGVTVGCRTVAIVSRWGMEIGWDAVEDDTLLGYSVESARQLGVNLMSYAVAERAWAKGAAHAIQLVDAAPPSMGKMSLAQIIYDGEWKTRHAGLSILLNQFNQKTEIPVKFAHGELRLTDPRLFDSPLLYMSGHEDFTLKEEEVMALREYLKRGGCLFAEACCGRKAFDHAFQRELGRVMPGVPLAPIPLRNGLFTMPNPLATVGVTPALAAQLGNKNAIEPRLMGLEQNGHFAVVYSPYGLAGGWELSQSPYAFGYDDGSAMKVGENILMYAITQ
jgi:hypothetical protein